MSLDKSLKVSNALARHRNVLTRAERVAKLIQEERWQEGHSVLGLPKTRVHRVVARKKAKAEEKPAEAAPAAATAGTEAQAEPKAADKEKGKSGERKE